MWDSGRWTAVPWVEIALKLKMYDLWENRKWKAHLASIASNNYNFDELFGRALRLESVSRA